MARRPRECIACGAACPPRYGIPDPCLGTLPGVRNACCGHGVERMAYVRLDVPDATRGPGKAPWVTYRGWAAWWVQKLLGGSPAPLKDLPRPPGSLPGWRRPILNRDAQG